MQFLRSILHAGVAAGVAVTLTACGGGHDHDHDHGGGHAHEPTFEGGFLVELGDHFANLEVVHDAEAGTLDIYVFGAHAEKMVQSSTEELAVSLDVHGDEPLAFVLAAVESSMTGNKKGASSKFSVTDERLKGLQHAHGTVASVEARGETFEDVTFDLGGHDEEDGHDDHDGHDHDGDDHEGHDHDGDDHDHDHDGEDSDG